MTCAISRASETMAECRSRRRVDDAAPVAAGRAMVEFLSQDWILNLADPSQDNGGELARC